ncbi:MAG: type II secretion system ATPase GspE [bacterium]
MDERLKKIMVNNGYISVDELEEALEIQQQSDEKLGQILIEMGYLDNEELIEVFEHHLDISRIDLSAVNLNPALADYIPENIARRYHTVPVALENDRLKVAMTDPTNLIAIDDIEMLSGCKVDTYIATYQEINRALNIIYSGTREEAEEVFKSLSNDSQNNEPDIDELKKMVDDAPIVRLTNIIINEAIKERASDIHIEPQEEKVRVRYRIDGVLKEHMTAPKHSQAAFISRLKIMADLDITKRRISQDGRVRINNQGVSVDMRVSTLPTIHGEKVVIRLLNKDEKLINIEKLGFNDSNLKKFKNLIKQPHGIVLATGPTGSGKSTTLFAALNELNTPEKNIVTIEDPVEYQIKGINQVQAHSQVGRSFASTLRSILRQDPDIIMIGEIRDKETAQIAIRAALTGHLVLSTLHTNDAVSSITRLIDMGIPSYLVAATVNGVIAQRLVRRLCNKCKEEYIPSLEDKKALQLKNGNKLYRSTGCSSCSKSGFKGRLALQEIFTLNDEIKDMIIQEEEEQKIKQAGRDEGMITLKEDGIDKVKAGLTTYQEMMRVII